MDLGKRFSRLTGADFIRMVFTAARYLHDNVNRVNALNVFPVPDGDTGTNMNLTMTSGVEELRKKQTDHIGHAAETLSKGLLMGARGNSGVILSQLFRGFAKSVQSCEEINAQQFAAALQQGVDTAYKAVVKPVEGTILTVAKEAAKHAIQQARRTSDVTELMEETFAAGNQSLARTPDLLPVLKQVGVVDAGGQGLMFIYEGFLAALSGKAVEAASSHAFTGSAAAHGEAAVPHASSGRSAQAQMSAEDIEFGYCTEFMVKLVPGKHKGAAFEETAFRTALSKFGDSLLVVADDELVKIHIHAEYPGEVMNYAMQYGDLTKIKIENMREQHSHIVTHDDEAYAHAWNGGLEQSSQIQGMTGASAATPVKDALKPNGMVAVAIGEGISKIFSSLGVDEIISGGQTMNPSTEDIVKAVRNVGAKRVYVLPNNSNIVLAAEQAKELVDDKELIVIPSKTIPQGIAAALSFQAAAEEEAVNTEAMNRVVRQVKSGQVTNAVRDTSIDGVDIKEGDFLGIMDGKIVASCPEIGETCRKLLDCMLAEGGDLVTVLSGSDAAEEETDALEAYLTGAYPDTEVEVHQGGQPVYAYLFGVE
ncbi:DAK2 domain-containing protein [Paenibacillus sp. MBLB4367]|uniref:DAK2 domain-containing protein n=1 Tax=Paenibacillus sp. MBLB4367 TaxID=3384767 RepID=UPI003907F16A